MYIYVVLLVFCVQSKDLNLHAISLSNVEDLLDREMDEVIQKELEISMLCSSLVTLKICPNFVLVYSLFKSKCPAPSQKFIKSQKALLWDKKFPVPTVYNPPNITDIPTAKQLNKHNGNYQFIKMEFCSGGDVEDYIRSITIPTEESTRKMIFQMCFSLYCAREQLSLRHFDIKLLNFFVTNTSTFVSKYATNTTTTTNKNNDDLIMRVGFEKDIYELHFNKNISEVVKLADFGTSEITSRSLNDCITVQQVKLHCY